ncbi:MAG: deoxyribodipyrimidine photo-lyase [Deltaproteobacteria bacterium]
MKGIPPATVVWFRRDLRLSDNPALDAAVARGGPVVAAWVHAPEEEGDSAPGGAGCVFLHDALRSLAASFEARGGRLVLRKGPSVKALIDLARETGADAVYANRVWEPAFLARDAKATPALREAGIDARWFDDGVLFPPDAVKTSGGGPFRVFTPFLRRCLSLPSPDVPCPAPRRIRRPAPPPPSLPLRELRLLPAWFLDAGIHAAWPAGEHGGWERLSRFLDVAMAAYPEDRDRPDRAGTSRLSPYLHFGCVGARQVWHAVQSRAAADSGAGTARGAEAFLRQLVWREFAHHLLVHFPGTVDAPLREEFAGIPWREDPDALAAWREGRTGYPLVDAGMRQLRKTGWMHNRVRMVVASFLVKDLLLPWQEGARWFHDTLVDGDLANNIFGWQWVAGCGADAAPYFRVFNPALQGEKFDPGGDYVRTWVPELARLPDRWIHRPWESPASVLSEAGVTPGNTYPRPILDHAAARIRALAALPRRGPKAEGTEKSLRSSHQRDANGSEGR